MLKAALFAGAAVASIAAAAAQDVVGDTITIVSTQKRDQSVLEVPINVTAYGGEFLDEIGVQQFDELAGFVPGLQIQEQSPNNPGFVIRGITSDSGESNIEPRVSVYQDGVSISRSRGSYVELFDIERVEIAKGPQSTLFGRGALIGAINIIQAKPEDEFSAELTAAAGNLGYDMVEGYVTGPLVDGVLAGRASFRVKTRDGYVENALGGTDFNSQEVQAYRGSLRFTPSETFTADLIANYQTDTPAATAFKSGTFAPTGGSLDPSEPAALNTFGNFAGSDLGLEREVYGVTLLADWELSPAYTLSSVSAWREFNSFESFDPDGSELPWLVFGEDAEGEQISQELRLRYDDGGRVSFFVGASYFYEEGTQAAPLQFDERISQPLVAGLISGGIAGAAGPLLDPTSPFFNPTLAGQVGDLASLANFIGVLPNVSLLPATNQIPILTVNPLTGQGVANPFFGGPLKPAHKEIFGNFAETTSFDVFGDVTFRVTDKLELIGGLRYSRDDKTAGGFGQLLNGPSTLTGGGVFITVATPDGQEVRAQRSDEFDGLSWRTVARYQATDDLNLYASYARGRNADVISANTATGVPGDIGFDILPDENVDSYEAGAKARLLGGALILEGSGFYYEYSNFQTTVIENGVARSFNAGNATSYGIETQAFATLAPNAEVFATYAWNRSRFDDTDDAGNPQAFADNQFRLSPDHSFSIGARVSTAVPGGELSFVPTYVWQSEVFFDNVFVPDDHVLGEVDRGWYVAPDVYAKIVEKLESLGD